MNSNSCEYVIGAYLSRRLRENDRGVLLTLSSVKRVSGRHRSGFALPLTMGFGVVMVLVGTVMVLRTERAQVTAGNQALTAQSLNVAESGVGRVLDLLAKNPTISLYSFSRWRTAANAQQGIPGLTSCSNTGATTSIQQFAVDAASWGNIDAADASKGQYKIVDYAYTGAQPSANTPAYTSLGTGTLTIQGRTNNSTATTNLQVNVPVSSGGLRGVPFPGLWLSDPSTNGPSGNQKVAGNVFLNNCAGTANLDTANGTDPSTGQAWQVLHPPLQMPSLPAEPVGITNLSPRLVGNNVSLTLPSANDPLSTVGTQQVYAYKIPGSLAKATITVPAGQKVYIWLDGSIEKNSELRHDCGNVSGCKPTDVQIYASGSAITSPTVPSMCLNGNRELHAFILAPNYTIGVTGGGAFKGSLWAKSWGGVQSCNSSSNHTVVNQTGNWAELAGVLPASTLPPKLDKITSWQRGANQ